jgi:microcystin degradation protein MlrC
MKIGVLSVFHETNTFSPIPTDSENFKNNIWLKGTNIIKAFEGTRTPIGGFLDCISERGDEAVPLFAAHATPAGVVKHKVFQEIIFNLRKQIEDNPQLDAIALELHGAAVVEGIDDPEAILCAEIRDLIGEKPLSVVTDFHANMTPERLKNATVWSGYRTNPHIDTYEAAMRALENLFFYIDSGEKPEFSFIRVPAIFPPILQSTGDPPFKGIIEKAKQLQEDFDLRDLIVHGGYSYSDIPYAGLSFTALGDSKDKLQRELALTELANFAWKSKDMVMQEILDIDRVMQLVSIGVRDKKKYAIADISDNINGGSAGDSTHVLAGFLKLDLKVLTTICDPTAVNLLDGVEISESINLSLGGYSHPAVGAPLKVCAQLMWRGDGEYVHEGLMNHGAPYSIGKAAWVRVDSVDILIQSFAQQPNDLAQFKIAGIDPSEYEVILLKGAAALRANWQSMVDVFVNISSPGITDCVLERLNYVNLSKNVWPLDKSITPTFGVVHIQGGYRYT